MRNSILLVVSVVCLMSASVAEARMGGGGSFGSRGMRGFSTTRPSYTPSYNNSNPYRQSAPQPGMNPMQQPMAPSGGGFMRGMMGGLAGGFLGSMLFRQMGYGGMGTPMEGGGGGIGMLEILLIAGAGFFLFRMLIARKAATAGASPTNAYTGYSAAPVGGAQAEQPQPEAALETLRRYDASFDPQRFKDTLTDGFFAVQSAWARRDLTPVRGLLAPEITRELEGQLSEMRSQGRINHLENIAVREIDVLEAWQERGQEYATVRFYANLLDYTVDEKTGQVLAGSQTSPVKFEEFWTYSRDVGGGASWRLTAVEQA